MEIGKQVNQSRLLKSVLVGISAVALMAGVKEGPGVARAASEVYQNGQAALDKSGGVDAPHHHWSLRRIAHLPIRQPEKAHKGDGFDDLAVEANHNTSLYTTGAIIAERQFLMRELENQTGRKQLWPGDTLDVPVLHVGED